MNRTLAVLAMMGFAGTIGVSAQMKHVDLTDAKGNNVGMAMISPAKGGGVSIDLTLKGLPPGEHGLHLHEVAKCEPPTYKSAGAHFNPAKKKHGALNPDGPHAGDMANFKVAANGTAQTTITNKTVTMDAGANSILWNRAGHSSERRRHENGPCRQRRQPDRVRSHHEVT